MIEFILFCIATVGMTSIITQGSIFAPLRQYVGHWAEKVRERREQWAQKTGKTPGRSWMEWFNELINCAQCTGFWCGLFCGFLIIPIEAWETFEAFRFVASAVFPVKFFLMWFCCGLGGSILATLGSNVVEWIFYHKMNALRKLEEQDRAMAERKSQEEEA
jgi:hypothetical protein